MVSQREINHELQPNVGMVGIGGSAYTISDAAALIVSGVEFLEERDKLKAVNADLLEALKELYENLFTDGFVTLDHMEKARAAIAKAEGL